MKRLVILLILPLFMLALYAINARAGDLKYDENEFKDAKKIASKILKNDIKKLKKLNVKKLIIFECYGDFTTSKEVTSGGWTSSRSQSVTSDYYTYTADRVYDIIKSVFEENGIEIVSKDILAANPVYQDFNLKEQKESKTYQNGVFRPEVKTEGQKISATGLGIYSNNVIESLKVLGKLGPITADIKADGILHIKFAIGIGKKFAPVLTSFDILLNADLRAREYGFKGNKKIAYDFYTQNAPIMNLKTPIINTADIAGKEKGAIDMDKYDKALMDMINGVFSAYRETLKEGLSEK